MPPPNRTPRRFDDPPFRYSPGSVDDTIESHIRHLRRVQKVVGKTQKEQRGPLGLSATELSAIYREAMAGFVDSAKLSEELREQRQRFRETFDDRLARFLKSPDAEMNRLAETQAVLFARQCDKAIGRATSEFADMLTQAVIARRGRKDFSLRFLKEIWAECLRFATGLSDFKFAGTWIDEAWGIDPREAPLPHLYRLDTISDMQAAAASFVGKFRPRFEDRIRMCSSGWLNEAANRIELRQLLSAASPHKLNTGDPSKTVITQLLLATPHLTTEQVCGKLDAANEKGAGRAPLPKAWQRRGARSWVDAYARFCASVKTFVSTVRKESGIPR